MAGAAVTWWKGVLRSLVPQRILPLRAYCCCCWFLPPQEGAGTRVSAAHVEVVFDNADGRFPVGAPWQSPRSTQYAARCDLV